MLFSIRIVQSSFIRKPTRETARKQYTEEDSEETEEDDGMLLTKKPSKRATAKKNVSTSVACSLLTCS